MKIAVVLPAHNEAPNIRTMVERLLARYDADILEIIVVDDASTDGTAAVVRRIGRAHPRVRLVGHPWPKLVANRAFHALAHLLLGIRQRDLTNNFKLYKMEIIKSIRWRNDTFAINAETGLLPILHGYRIAEVPVSWIQRSKSMESSSFQLFRVGPQYLRVLWRAWRLHTARPRRPLTTEVRH